LASLFDSFHPAKASSEKLLLCQLHAFAHAADILFLINEFTKMLGNVLLVRKGRDLVDANVPAIASFQHHHLLTALCPQ
jgi:hypothetical protein